ncbi:MAG: hypothetical protein WA755_04785 [Candidatus Acidiferrales bacterium]
MTRIVVKLLVLAGLISAVCVVSAHAQGSGNCTVSQSMAVRCFVPNAVQTRIAQIPSGMSLTQFEAYGVTVMRIMQSGTTFLALIGTSAAVSDAMPATNSNGTADAAAQTTALNAIVAAALANNIIALPTQATTSQMQMFAQNLTNNFAGNAGMSLSPGAALRLIDSYIDTSTDSNGNVNWTTVDSSINTAIGNLVASGFLKLPSTITQAQVTAFAEAVAQAIATYKTATNRTTL